MTKAKKSTKKKVLKWFLGTILTLLIVLISAPFLFKDKIVQLVTNTINNNINATLTYNETDLSLLKHFPQASLSIKDIAIINKAPFLGDTLYAAKSLNLQMNITELFKNPNEIITIKNIETSDAEVNILVNENGATNYDITLNSDTKNENSKNSFSFNINSYSLKNVNVFYFDANNKNELHLAKITHSGKGNFDEDIFNLDTETNAVLSLKVNNTPYLQNVNVKLDATLALDIKNLKYTFKENKGFINQLPLEFQGSIQQIDENQLYNLQFKTPNSSFKNALALFPKEITGNLTSINTEGNFDLNGYLKGTLSKKTIPTFTISIVSKNAMFKYANLPKAVKNIYLNAQITNKTGLAIDTYIVADKLSFLIDDDSFNSSGKVSNLTTNPNIQLKAIGKISLDNISKVYPIQLEKKLQGILNADVFTSFDVNSVKNKKYQNIKNSGTINVVNFKYDGADVANPFIIDKTSLNFNSNTIQLTNFKAKTGSSDLSLKGDLTNFYGFLFNKEQLKGNFSLNSNQFKVDDFLTKNTSENTNSKSKLKIPSFLNIQLNANAKNVIYDNINLKNTSGTIIIKEETLQLKQLNSSVFDGNIAFNGNVSTKEENPVFSMDLDLKQLNIVDAFSNVEMLSSIAPIARTIQGKINTTLNLSGNLKDDMTPNLQSLKGKLLGELFNTRLNASNSKMLNLLDGKLSFLDVNKLNLNNVKAYFSFDNGTVTIKPIPISYKDINMTVGGTHGFDKSINYNINVDVPVKYLGSEITSALAKLTPKDASEIKTIPVKAILNGSFTNPSITTNNKKATSNLMSQIVEKQKQNLKDKGKDKLKDLLGLKKNDSIKKDSVQKPKDLLKDKAKDVLKNLFGKKKKDTVKNN